jgi:hypothetical protein
MIGARVCMDDSGPQVDFDATPWFETATDAQILALADCGWGGDDPADEVAQAMRTVHEVDALFVLIEHGRAGYESRIDPGDALAWLAEHRPQLQLPAPEEEATREVEVVIGWSEQVSYESSITVDVPASVDPTNAKAILDHLRNDSEELWFESCNPEAGFRQVEDRTLDTLRLLDPSA